MEGGQCSQERVRKHASSNLGLIIGPAREGEEGVTNSSSLTSATHLGLAFEIETRGHPETGLGESPSPSRQSGGKAVGSANMCALALCLLPPQFKLPKEYSWPEKKLKVSILPDVVFDSPLH